jgi:hypothetical protein
MNVFKEQFDPDIEKKLSVLEDVPARDPEAAARGRVSFLAEARTLAPPVQHSESARNGWFGALLAAFGGRRHSHAFAVIASIALVLVILLGGTSATVYAAQGSMPDQVLYSVKLLSEDLRLGLTSNPQAELGLTLDLVERRMDEIILLVEAGDEVPDSVINRLEVHLDQVLNVAEVIEDDEVEPVMIKIEKHLRDRIQDYTQTKGRSQDGPKEGDWDRIRDMLQTNLDKVDTGLKDPAVFRHSNRTNMRHLNRYEEESEGELAEEPVVNSEGEPGEGEPSEGSGNAYGPGPQPEDPPGGSYGPGPEPGEIPGNTFGPGSDEDVIPGTGYGPGPQPEEPPDNSSNGPGPQPEETPGSTYGPGPSSGDGGDSGSGSSGESSKKEP